MRPAKWSHLPRPDHTPRGLYAYERIPTRCGRFVSRLGLYSGYRSATWKEAPLCPKCAIEALIAPANSDTEV